MREKGKLDQYANISSMGARLRRLTRALAGEVENINIRLTLAHIAISVLPSLCFVRLRTIVYRLAGIRIGAGTVILGRMEFTEARAVQERLQIGAHTIINKRFFADVTGDIRVGNRVSIGHHVVLITASHAIGAAGARAGALTSRSIVIEDGCWIGARSTILPGVRIGASSVVAAGSLVAADVPPNILVGGVPARLIKSLPTDP